MTSDRNMFKVLAVSSMKREMTTGNYTVRYFFLKNINFEIKFILVFTKINHSNDTKESLKIDIKVWLIVKFQSALECVGLNFEAKIKSPLTEDPSTGCEDEIFESFPVSK